MADEIDEMLVSVRADTGAFRRDVAVLRAELEGRRAPMPRGGGSNMR